MEITRDPNKSLRVDTFTEELKAAGIAVESVVVLPEKIVIEGTKVDAVKVEQLAAAHDASAVPAEEKKRLDQLAKDRTAVKAFYDKASPTVGDVIPALKVWAREWLIRNGGA